MDLCASGGKGYQSVIPLRLTRYRTFHIQFEGHQKEAAAFSSPASRHISNLSPSCPPLISPDELQIGSRGLERPAAGKDDFVP